jgi:glucose/arabinose dehydrogenase
MEALTTYRSFQEASVKKIVLALAVAVATAAAANAQTAATKAPAAKPAAQTKSTAPKAEKAAPMKAEVVSADPTAKTITVKDASGSNVTLTATGSAVAELSKVKAGDWVMVTKAENNATHISKVKETTSKAHKEKK